VKNQPENILCINFKVTLARNALLLTEICQYGVVVRRRLPQGRLILVVVEAEDLAIDMKGSVSRICILK